MVDEKDKEDVDLDKKIAKFLTLLTSSLLHNGLELLKDLETTPFKLVSSIYKVPFCGCYLSLSIMGILLFLKKLSLACVYPEIPPLVGMPRDTLKRYLLFWTSANQKGILTCEEKIIFMASLRAGMSSALRL